MPGWRPRRLIAPTPASLAPEAQTKRQEIGKLLRKVALQAFVCLRGSYRGGAESELL
jgi:hypothetical protein